MKRPRLCFVASVPMVVTAFLNAHIGRLNEDFDIFVVSDFSAGVGGVSPLATCIHVPIKREIAIFHDIVGLWKLFQTFRRYRFEVVHSVTPKAGLLSMLAGFFAQVPVRIHWFTGQVWVTRQGLARKILKAADRIITLFATHLLADSPSQRDFLVEEHVCDFHRIEVIGDGSICGVDTLRFCPNSQARLAVRKHYGIPLDAPLILFLGRLNIDKGLREIGQVMVLLESKFPQLHWLFVGPDEAGMEAYLRNAGSQMGSRLSFHGYSLEPEIYMSAADIFCLPSYREGFGNSVIEAAAAGVPAVASSIYGLTDAIENGVTGLLVEARDVEGLADALSTLLIDPSKASSMGAAARARAALRFSQSRVVEGLYLFYQRLPISREHGSA